MNTMKDINSKLILALTKFDKVVVDILENNTFLELANGEIKHSVDNDSHTYIFNQRIAEGISSLVFHIKSKEQKEEKLGVSYYEKNIEELSLIYDLNDEIISIPGVGKSESSDIEKSYLCEVLINSINSLNSIKNKKDSKLTRTF